MKDAIRLALLPAALCASFGALAQQTATPIQNVIVLFQENVSFDHYFGTYPNAQNNTGETPFYPYPLTPTVNGLGPELLTSNPNLNAAGTAKVNPVRLSPAQAYTCSQNHNYGPEQQALDSGMLDLFPKYTGRVTSEGCAADGSTVLAYYDGNTVTALWNYAQNYALNDNSFGSTFGPSSPGAINLVSGQTYNGTLYFGSGTTTSAYPTTYASGSTVVTDIGDFDPYLDDCGADAGGTATGTATLRMNGKNIGDLLNAAGVTWGWFQGGFAPTTAATVTSTGTTITPASCGAAHTEHPGVPNPNWGYTPNGQYADIHVSTPDYVPHHNPFQMYASTSNPHHLPPTAGVTIGAADPLNYTTMTGANHNYDASVFIQALQNGTLPAVSFVKAPAYENGHPGNSDPTSEQNWIVNVINTAMQSPQWNNMLIIIAYDDSDGWYDHVTGPVVSPSKTAVDAYNGTGECGNPVANANPARCGHGPRLPLLVISPWANPNFVDHTLTDQTSVIAFIEQNWNVGYIDGATAPAAGQASFDRAAGTITNMLNFGATPWTAPLFLNCNGTYAASTPAAGLVCP